jgi:hypothetical protein
VRRLSLAIIVALLSISVSGVSALVVTERCTTVERSSAEDDACPPTCITCGCCAQAAEPVMLDLKISPHAPTADIGLVIQTVPTTQPRDILHVPKHLLA